MSRVLPTAPGWWWAQWKGDEAQPVFVWVMRGKLVADLPNNGNGDWCIIEDALWTWLEPIPAPGEVEALRRQVAELTALGVSLHKAEDRGRRGERAAIVAWLRQLATEPAAPQVVTIVANVSADHLEQGAHEVDP